MNPDISYAAIFLGFIWLVMALFVAFSAIAYLARSFFESVKGVKK